MIQINKAWKHGDYPYIVASLSQASKEIQERQLCHFFRADATYGSALAAGLGIKADYPLS